MYVGKTGRVLFRAGYYKNSVEVQNSVRLGVTRNLWGKGKVVGVWGGGIFSKTSLAQKIYKIFEEEGRNPLFDPEIAVKQHIAKLSTAEIVDVLKYMCKQERPIALVVFDALATVDLLKAIEVLKLKDPDLEKEYITENIAAFNPRLLTLINSCLTSEGGGEVKTLVSLANVYNQRAHHATVQKKYDQAIEDLSRAIEYLERAKKLAPNDVEVLVYLSNAYHRRAQVQEEGNQSVEDLSQTIGCLEQAKKLSPNNVEILTYLATAYYHRAKSLHVDKKFNRAIEDIDQSIEDLEKAKELSASNPGVLSKIISDLMQAYYAQGVNYTAIGKSDLANEYFAKSRALEYTTLTVEQIQQDLGVTGSILSSLKTSDKKELSKLLDDISQGRVTVPSATIALVAVELNEIMTTYQQTDSELYSKAHATLLALLKKLT